MDMPITLGMLALFFRSVYEIVSHTGAGYLDSLAGLVFFLLIGRWFQQKTYRSLSFDRDYSSYFPIAATRLEDGHEVAVPVKNIQPGDRLFIRYAELIPADGVLITGQGHIDYSFVTGEADIIDKRSGDAVFAGGRHMGEPFEMEVTRKTDQSYLTSLWSNAAFDDDRKEKAQRLADTVGKYFTVAVVAIALGTLAYWWPRDIGIAMQAFAAVLIIACPCAIALSIPFTYGNILRLMARRSFFIKHTGVIESIQGLSRIVFDKTGTLTAAEQSRVSYTGHPLSEADKSALRSLAFQSSHPASRRLQRYLENGQLLAVTEVDEQVGAGVSGTVAGRRWLIGSPAYLSTKGIAPPASNGRGVCIAVDGAPLGEFTFDNAYRPGLRSVIDQLARRYRISLLTGDNDRERQWLESSLGNDLLMHFDQRPEDKLHYVKNRQLDGEKVLMIGDGLNDAGALRQADVGIVLTENTNNFTPASDAIIAADRFEDIPQILRFIAGSNRLIYAAYGLALVYNVVGLSYAVTGALSPLIAAILMPLSSVTIVAFGVLSSTWMANRHGLGKNTIDQHQNNT
jgi:P-type Cu+ transporter